MAFKYISMWQSTPHTLTHLQHKRGAHMCSASAGMATAFLLFLSNAWTGEKDSAKHIDAKFH